MPRRLTVAGDILISQISPAQGPASEDQPALAAGMPVPGTEAPTPASAVPGPSIEDLPGVEPPLLWPAAAQQPAELLTGAAGAEAKLRGRPRRPHRPEWLRESESQGLFAVP
jgi:hypothetical protein